jgi:hypothetical protein
MNSDPSPGDAYYVVLAAFAAQMVVTVSNPTLPKVAAQRPRAFATGASRS